MSQDTNFSERLQNSAGTINRKPVIAPRRLELFKRIIETLRKPGVPEELTLLIHLPYII